MHGVGLENTMKNLAVTSGIIENHITFGIHSRSSKESWVYVEIQCAILCTRRGEHFRKKKIGGRQYRGRASYEYQWDWAVSKLFFACKS